MYNGDAVRGPRSSSAFRLQIGSSKHMRPWTGPMRLSRYLELEFSLAVEVYTSSLDA